MIYTATLQYQDKWDALAALRNDSSQPPGDRSDLASIELWAMAFRNVPPETLHFRSSSMLLPMSVSAVGTPLVPVRIKGRVYNFWLDTGSSMTMLASDVARDLNITPITRDTLEIVTSTGRVSSNPSLIPELQIGQLTVRNAPTMIVDEAMMRMREPTRLDLGPRVKIDGIIGFDIIRQLDLEVDYGDATLLVRNPATSRRHTDRNMFWVGLPVVRMTTTDGTLLHFGLDTGAQLTFVTETLLYKLGIEAARTESRRVGGLGGEISPRVGASRFTGSRARSPDTVHGRDSEGARVPGARFAGRSSGRRCLAEWSRPDRHDQRHFRGEVAGHHPGFCISAAVGSDGEGKYPLGW